MAGRGKYKGHESGTSPATPSRCVPGCCPPLTGRVAWCVLGVGVEGYDAVVNVFFELDVRHTALFVHPDRARPDPLLPAAKSAACVQRVDQKLKSDLLPLLGRRARRQLEVRRYTLACSALLPNIPVQASDDFAVDLLVNRRWGSWNDTAGLPPALLLLALREISVLSMFLSDVTVPW